MKTFAAMLTAAALTTVGAQAQNQSKEVPRVEQDVLKVVPGKEAMTFERHAFVLGGPDAVEFVSAEASIVGKIVKGAPYSAEAVTESTQTLADGNRISSKSSAATYRDSEGRTRREMALSMPGMADPPTFITINDPVANASYHLDTKAKIARKLPVAPEGVSFGVAGAGVASAGVASGGMTVAPAVRAIRGTAVGTHEPAAGGAMITIEQTSGRQNTIRLRSGGEPKSEPLGKRAIDGVEVEGSRSTITIPAGEVGNARDIHIVTERWYSPELQTVIMSKHSDPRMGETTYSLTNIKRGDPHPSLFQVPSDYTLSNEEGMPGVRVFRKIERK